MSEQVSAIFGMYDVGWQVIKFLAVVGGAATGGLASGWVLRLLGSFATRKKVPAPAMVAVRGLGGVGAGLAVWMWVSGTGGGGPGQGGFWGPGEPGAPTRRLYESNSSPSNPGTKEPSVEKTKTPIITDATKAETNRIDLLGGARVQDGRFYRIDGEKGALTLAELRNKLEQRLLQKTGPRVKSIELVIYLNSVAEDHAAVRDLRNWARDNDLEVKVISVDRELP
jgi:hypothetical protein